MPKISELDAAGSVSGTDTLVIVQGGETKKATVSQLPSGGGGSTPTGTGFRHVTSGSEDAASKLVENADVHTSAAIAVTKLATGGSGTVLTSDGATNAFAQIANANVDASAAIAVSKLAAGSANTVLCGGSPNSFRAIVNADVDAAAAIAGSKLQAASSGNAGSMSAADKTKLDGLQTQGSAVAMGALDIDWSAGSVFTKTLAAGATTFTFSNASSGKVIVVRVTSATAPSTSTLTWPTVRWAGGTAPTQTPSGTDVYTFVHDGTNIYGSVVQDMS